jgi:hypothetical protein
MIYKNIILKKIFGIMVPVFVSVILTGCSSDVNYTPPPNSQEMAITHYSFGKIIVDGKTYAHDIAIVSSKTVKNWRAKINHAIQLVDIKDLIDDSTQRLIIGIGANDACSVTQEIVEYTKSKGIQLHMLNTYEAVKLFNSLPKKGLSACFHVNC